MERESVGRGGGFDGVASGTDAVSVGEEGPSARSLGAARCNLRKNANYIESFERPGV